MTRHCAATTARLAYRAHRSLSYVDQGPWNDAIQSLTSEFRS